MSTGPPEPRSIASLLARYRLAVFLVAVVSFSIGMLAYLAIQQATAGAVATTAALGGLNLGLVVVLGLLLRVQRAFDAKSRTRILDRLDEVSRKIQSAPPAHTHSAIVEGARALVPADVAALIVLRPGSFYEVASVIRDGDVEIGYERLASLGIAILGSLGYGRNLRIAHLDQAPAEGQVPLGPILAERISSDTEALGLLLLIRLPGAGTFDDLEESLLRQLTHQAARAIEADHHEREQDRKEEELERAGRLKGVFLANMSHELRTPLSAIIGFSDLMLEGADGELTPELREDLLQINTSGKSLLQLVNDILDLSKIEAGRMILEVCPVDLDSVLQEVMANLRPLAQARSLSLQSEVEASLPSVLGDALRVRQILLNLISNGIKFTQEGGVTIRCRTSGDLVEVSVDDTGIGIPPEAMDRIFQEFTQADDGSKRKFGGTGLGLAITEKLVSLHGGQMGVESTPGEGSRFWFTIPCQPNSRAQAPVVLPPAVAAAEPTRGTWAGQTRDLILAIDDAPADLSLIARRLQESGFETAVAGSATDALRIARELHPAAITLDIMMPEMDGWKVLSTLKEDPLTRDIPVLVVSVVDGRERAVELGAAGFMTKPISRPELSGMLADVLPDLDDANILCVDDEEQARDLIRRSLEMTGARVRAVATAAEALEEVDRDRPDAIFIDLMMPEMSGFELIARLRNRPALATVPIIVVSARELTGDDVAALGANIDRFIRKSEVRAGDLVATIRQAIDHRRQPVSTDTPTAP